jgi:cystathionine beta-lyase/cystathionine gamma-synthase
MEDNKILSYLANVLDNMPASWLSITTHRLDIYEEKLAKTQFLDQFEVLFANQNTISADLEALPTAYDYIRLGHPLSCILEWTIGKLHHISSDRVISFSSKTIPVLAVLRKNLLDNRPTQIVYTGTLPSIFEVEVLQNIYGYQFELVPVNHVEEIPSFEGSTIFVTQQTNINDILLTDKIDFFVGLQDGLGSILLINEKQNADYISAIQHVRRRETIAMTPANVLLSLRTLLGHPSSQIAKDSTAKDKLFVQNTIREITNTSEKVLVGSSGLSIQYAIMMGLIHDAIETHPDKAIKIIVPPNCYGGTNDQARRVAACMNQVEIVDLPVDGDNDMVQSIDTVLTDIAAKDAIPYIIAEIPTNPRVEVPNLIHLKEALSKERTTATGQTAIAPVFILDQTFCPNVHFLGQGQILSGIKAISYASGSKFPSGGECTAGYCVANHSAKALMNKIEQHLTLCDNEATALQYQILATRLPSMKQRIKAAYQNTRTFVTFIQEVLPTSKINFVSEELAEQGFTPSVFSLDLPTKGNSDAEREAYKRRLNLKLINLMIQKIPTESKFCVSYGQLKGCYWTIPATSTQGTTKEGDKDYIVRASLSPDMNLDRHKEVFLEFVADI